MTKNQDWFIYIIEANNGHFYTGITTDVKRRWQEHLDGKKGAKFFKTSQAKKIVYIEFAKNRSEASKREAAIKKLNKSEKLLLLGANTNKLSILG